jgi:hypothetical protein
MGTEGLAPVRLPGQYRPMLRLVLIGLLLPLAACGASQPPVQSVSASPKLFRGAGQEVRLRCGSERLRARLRQGEVLAQVGEGEQRVLVPVDDPRGQAGQAYSDGKLTLYKVPDSEAWALAGASSGAAQCSHEPAGN